MASSVFKVSAFFCFVIVCVCHVIAELNKPTLLNLDIPLVIYCTGGAGDLFLLRSGFSAISSASSQFSYKKQYCEIKIILNFQSYESSRSRETYIILE